MSKEPHYGRWFVNGDTCYLGYFSFEDDNQEKRFSGKGMRWSGDGELIPGSEGLYTISNMDNPAT